MKKLPYVLGIVALLGFAFQHQVAGRAQTPATEMQLLSRIAQQPADIVNYLELAKVYRANKRFDEAEQLLLRAVDLLREERRTGQPFNVAPTMARPTAQTYDRYQAPVRVGGDIREPRKLKNVAPVYPAVAQTARITGVVIMDIIVGRDGRVTDAKVLRSIPLLDQAAVDAVRQWEFEPTLLNGVPVEVVMTVTVNFSLG